MNYELLKQCVDAIDALREWIAAVPADTPLPAMPGVDGDWLDSVHEKLRAELAKSEHEPAAWGQPDACGNIVETISPYEKEGEMKAWANQYSIPLYK